MTYEEFIELTKDDAPSASLADPLKALWHAHKGEWEAAHTTAQDITSQDGSWIHAYLHREEGDIGNAHYWYSRARKSASAATLEEELESITRELVERY